MPWASGDTVTSDKLNYRSGNVFNVKDPAYGAVGDGVTDDTTAIQAADSAAASGSASSVFFPPGSYAISATLSISNSVSWLFAPGAELLAIGTAFGPMVQTAIVAGGFGNRYGRVVGMRLDGNSIATQGLFIQQSCVQRYFESVDVRNCTSQGIIVSAAQNNTLVACHAELNGNNGADDANLVLDLGAGNNVFLGCEFSNEHATTPTVAGARYNVLILQSGVSPGEAFTVPSGNGFFMCRAERVSTSTLAAIEQRAGRYNSFNRCDIQTTGSRDAVRVDSTDGVSSGLRFTDCFFSGQAGSSTVFRLTGTHTPAVILEGMNFWENFTVGFAVADTTNAELLDVPQGSVTTFVSALGTDTAPGLVVSRMLRVDGTPSSSTGVPPGIANSIPHIYDQTNRRLWAYVGEWIHAPFRGVSTPAALASGNNNDYALVSTGELTLRLSADAATSTLTGIAGGVSMRRLRIINVSANNLTLAHQDANSSAANRLLSPAAANVVLALDDVADLEYDGTILRWRIMSVLQ